MKNFMCASFYDFNMGGTQTYFIRMFKWASLNGYRPFLLIHKDRTVDSIWKERFEEDGISVVFFRFTMQGVSIENKCMKLFETESVLITPDIHCFLHFMQLERKYNLKTILYILHPHFSKVANIKMINIFYRGMLEKYVGQSIIYMDQECFDYFKNYYKSNCKVNIYYRVSDFILPLNNKLVLAKVKEKVRKINLLTITRFDFPTKGYILGLLKELNLVNFRKCNYQFTVIGDGPDLKRINDLYQTLDDAVKSHVYFKGNIPYDELQSYYQEATIYIGMGTTLIEACKYGIPAITATAFQENNVTSGFFYLNPENLGGNIKYVDSAEKITSLIQYIIDCNEEEYCKIANAGYEAIRENYSIETTMKRILDLKTDKKTYYRGLCAIDYILTRIKLYVQANRKYSKKEFC